MNSAAPSSTRLGVPPWRPQSCGARESRTNQNRRQKAAAPKPVKGAAAKKATTAKATKAAATA
jgi:hypothetical protein